MASPQYKSFSLAPVPGSQHAVRLTVSNPPLNLVNATFLTEIHDYLASLANNPDTAPKVVIVASADPDIWIHHLDLHLVSAEYPLPAAEGDPHHLLGLLGGALTLLNTLPTIFIAEVNGLAVGGGNEFAVNMDMRFAGPGARFGIPEVGGGIIHGGGLQKVTKLVGPGRAMEYMLSCRAITGIEAGRIGLVNRATQSEDHLREYVNTLAARIASFPRQGIEATKTSVRQCMDGEGSMAQDMQRLGQLAHTAQDSISQFIERGEHHGRNEFELRLPDSCAEIWQV